MSKLFFALALLAFSTACTTLPKPSLVKYPVEGNEAVVGIGDEPLSQGDVVGIFTETCREKRGVGPMKDTFQTTCLRNRIAAGKVTNIIPQNNEALISTGQGVELHKGLIVVKE